MISQRKMVLYRVAVKNIPTKRRGAPVCAPSWGYTQVPPCILAKEPAHSPGISYGVRYVPKVNKFPPQGQAHGPAPGGNGCGRGSPAPPGSSKTVL